MASYPWKIWKKSGGFGLTGSGPPPTDDLTSQTRDSLFSAQLIKLDPTALDAESLLTAKIVETHHYGNSVFRTLTKYGIVDAAGHPDTTKIDKTLVSKIGILSVPKQRELVNMLFFWEEELTRWRLLDEEAADIKGAITAGMNDSGLEEKLAVVEAKKKVVPSMRKEDGTVKTDGAAPPEYRG